jgi:hypothetical protein
LPAALDNNIETERFGPEDFLDDINTVGIACPANAYATRGFQTRVNFLSSVLSQL